MNRIAKEMSKQFNLKGGAKKQCMRCIYILAGMAVIYFAYTIIIKPKTSIEGLANGGKTLVMFHMNGCGHCVKLMPEWNAFEKENNTGILTKKMERGEAGDLLEKHNISGFPTILLLDHKNNKVADYGGERTKKGLLAFCQKHN